MDTYQITEKQLIELKKSMKTIIYEYMPMIIPKTTHERIIRLHNKLDREIDKKIKGEIKWD